MREEDQKSGGKFGTEERMDGADDGAPQVENRGTDRMTIEEGTGRATPSLPYPLVAVGASAGGLQASASFWRRCPSERA